MFLFFLAISIILWLLVKLKYEYVYTITYNVNLTGVPENKVVTSPDSLTVDIKVKALGYNLIRYKLFKYYKPLSVVVGRIQSKNDKYFIFLPNQFDRLAAQLGSDLTLVEISPDTLYFQFSDVVQKSIPVKPDLKITFSKQFMQAGSYTVKPVRVIAQGPASIIDTLRFAYTQPLVLDGISNNIDIVLPVKPINGLTFRPETIRIFIPVEKFTEAKVEVPISCINLPDGYDVLLSPRNITITCNVAESKYFTLKPEHFTVMCDYNELRSVSSNKAIVRINKYPDYIGRIQMEPRTVEFVIVKKK